MVKRFGAAVLLALCCLGVRVEAADVVAVARVGDGSEAAKAYAEMEAKVLAQQKAIWSPGAENEVIAISGPLDPATLPEAFKKSLGGEGSFSHEVSGSASVSVGEGNFPQFDGFHAQWAVQIKKEPRERKEAGRRITQMIQIRDGGEVFDVYSVDGYGDYTWLAVRVLESGEESKDFFRDSLRDTLKKGGAPLTAQQEDQLGDLYKEQATAWKAVMASPSDRALAKRFYDAIEKSAETRSFEYGYPREMVAVLKPNQVAVLRKLYDDESKNVTAVRINSSGTGSISISTRSSGKPGEAPQMTVQFRDKPLPEASKALVENVNATYKTSIAVPLIDPALADTKVSVRLELTSAEEALAKLANALGAQVVEKNGVLTVKAK